MKITKEKTLLVPVESWWYLNNKCHEERIGKPLTEEQKERQINHAFRSGELKYKEICNGDFGGCIGNPENAFEEGRWKNWSIDDMKQMLDEAGLSYKDGEEKDFIHVCLI